MYLTGFGTGWGGSTLPSAAFLPLTAHGEDLDLSALPEEVRAGVEAHRDELHDPEDLQKLIDELMLRR